QAEGQARRDLVRIETHQVPLERRRLAPLPAVQEEGRLEQAGEQRADAVGKSGAGELRARGVEELGEIRGRVRRERWTTRAQPGGRVSAGAEASPSRSRSTWLSSTALSVRRAAGPGSRRSRGGGWTPGPTSTRPASRATLAPPLPATAPPPEASAASAAPPP